MKKLIIRLLLLLFTQNSYSQNQGNIDIAKIMYTENQILGSKILKEIYSKLNINVYFIDLPGFRAIEEVTQGRVVGEVHRPFSFGEEHPMLIRITPAINYMQLKAFSKNKSIKVDGWNSISNYRIGIIKGSVYVEKSTKNMPNVFSVNTLEQLIEMNLKDHIDLFITDEYNALILLKRLKQNDKIKPLSKPLTERIDLYHYINRNYKNIADKVQAVVEKMNKSGELETLNKKLRIESIKNAK